MKRRNFLCGAASVGLLAGGTLGWRLGWPRAARAQQRQTLPSIGLLDAWGRASVEAGLGLAANGFGGGKAFKFEHSPFVHDAQQLTKFAADLVQRQVALILAFSTRAALAAKAATNTVPIIFLADDPVAAGLVDHLTSPGGNLTGVTNSGSTLIGKRIEIARELVPTSRLVALVTDPTNPTAHEIEVREARAITKALGLELSITEWSDDRSIEPALSELPRDRKLVLVFGGGPPFRHRGYLLAHLAVSYGLAAVHGNRTAADDGGLASFGPRYADGAHLMGVLAARVLNGEQPSGLPVRRIARTELVINPWPAKSLGLQLPSALLARADEVIE